MATAETLYVMRWKGKKAPPVDYSVCDAYGGQELYVTSDQEDALAERRRLGKVRPVKLLAVVYGRTYQAVFLAGLKPEGWWLLRTRRAS